MQEITQGSVADRSITLLKLAAEVTAVALGGAAASHTHGAGDINSGVLDAARIPVTAKIADADAEMVEKYADAFSATVKNGKLVVCNARGGGFVFYLR